LQVIAQPALALPKVYLTRSIMSISHDQELDSDAHRNPMNINFRLSQSFIDTSRGKTKPIQRSQFLSQGNNCDLAEQHLCWPEGPTRQQNV